MKIFIDFDDVLFNTKQFKKDLIDIFKRSGVTEEQYAEERYWNGKYNLKKQIKSLGSKYGVDTNKLIKDTDNLFVNLSEYVFPDVKEFLKKIGKTNLFLISYGNQEMQWRKIEKARLVNSFQEIIITDDKVKAVRGILKEYEDIQTREVCFIDDRVKYLAKIKKAFPEITTILMKRPEGRYENEHRNKTDIVKYGLVDIF